MTAAVRRLCGTPTPTGLLLSSKARGEVFLLQQGISQ